MCARIRACAYDNVCVVIGKLLLIVLYHSYLSTFQYQFQQMRKTGGAGFVVESALQDLLRYADKYHEPVRVLSNYFRGS